MRLEKYGSINSYYISTGHGMKEVAHVFLFDKDGVKYKTRWFGFMSASGFMDYSRAPIVLSDIELKLKRKEDFTADYAFYLPNKGKYSFEETNYNVYIPLSKLTCKQLSHKSIFYNDSTLDEDIFQLNDNPDMCIEVRYNQRITVKNQKFIDMETLIDSVKMPNSLYNDELRRALKSIRKSEDAEYLQNVLTQIMPMLKEWESMEDKP